jgi:hypothetical protein
MVPGAVVVGDEPRLQLAEIVVSVPAVSTVDDWAWTVRSKPAKRKSGSTKQRNRRDCII